MEIGQSPNGHHAPLPEGCVLATPDMLEEIYTEWIVCDGLSKRKGQDVRVLISAIPKADYYLFLPPGPVGSDDWPEAEREERTRMWLAGLSPEERQDRMRSFNDVTYKVMAAGMLAPTVTIDTARRYVEDSQTIARGILKLSGLLKEPEVAQKPTADSMAPPGFGVNAMVTP
jgi:hypothetical protein